MSSVLDALGYDVIGAAFNVRKNTGRGLLEKFYESALVYELKHMGHRAESQVAIPALYCGVEIQEAYRADIVVDNKVIIEVKARASMDDHQTCQLHTYLKLSGMRLGYLINFGALDFSIGNLEDQVPYNKGIYRMVNGY